MCLGIPGKITGIEGEEAIVSVGGVLVEVQLALVGEANVGDYVLVHAGFAIEKLSEVEAQETLNMIASLDSRP